MSARGGRRDAGYAPHHPCEGRAGFHSNSPSDLPDGQIRLGKQLACSDYPFLLMEFAHRHAGLFAEQASGMTPGQAESAGDHLQRKVAGSVVSDKAFYFRDKRITMASRVRSRQLIVALDPTEAVDEQCCDEITARGPCRQIIGIAGLTQTEESAHLTRYREEGGRVELGPDAVERTEPRFYSGQLVVRYVDGQVLMPATGRTCLMGQVFRYDDEPVFAQPGAGLSCFVPEIDGTHPWQEDHQAIMPMPRHMVFVAASGQRQMAVIGRQYPDVRRVLAKRLNGSEHFLN
jgi:hypothetical protein